MDIVTYIAAHDYAPFEGSGRRHWAKKRIGRVRSRWGERVPFSRHSDNNIHESFSSPSRLVGCSHVMARNAGTHCGAKKGQKRRARHTEIWIYPASGRKQPNFRITANPLRPDVGALFFHFDSKSHSLCGRLSSSVVRPNVRRTAAEGGQCYCRVSSVMTGGKGDEHAPSGWVLVSPSRRQLHGDTTILARLRSVLPWPPRGGL